MTAAENPHVTLSALIEELARREPDLVALREGDRSLTFAGLGMRVAALAGALTARGVEAGGTVAVALPRSIDLMVACLAVMRAGGVVLSLDLHLPEARNRKVVEAAKARWSIHRGADVPACVAHTAAIDILQIQDAQAPPALRGAMDPAFLVFTSGSSGEPKGVVLPHRALTERSRVEQAACRLMRDDIYLSRASPAFIALPVALEVLAASVTVVIARDGMGDDPAYLAELIRAERITFAGLPPRVTESLLALPEVAASLASLRTFRTFGEGLPPEVASRFQTLLPGCRLVDSYGTTEAGGIVTTLEVGDPHAKGPAGPAGKPLQGFTLCVVAPDGTAATEGEIWVHSSMLASGYLGGESGGSAKFLHVTAPGDTLPRNWYRTGDLGHLGADGRLTVLGRLDVRLNVGGVRADPVEIENALRLHPSVVDAAAWTKVFPDGRSRLVGYIVDRGEPASAAVLRSFLAASLPNGLIPARFVRVKALPLTPSGKVDRPSLPPPETTGPGRLAPRSDGEKAMLDLFRDVLEMNDLGVRDDFFEWGGDSLKAVALMARVFEVTGIKLPAATLLNAPTVEDLAKEIARGDPGQVMAVWMRKSGDREPLVCLPGLAADPLWMLPLMAALDPRQPLLGLSFVGLKPPITIADAALRGAAELRAAQPRGPYFMLGHSLGGVLAFEMARELIRLGEEVAFVGLIDTKVPGTFGPRPSPRGRPPWTRLRDWRSTTVRAFRARLRKLLSAAGLRAEVPFVPGFRDAVRLHRVEPCDLAVTLFRARDRGPAADPLPAWAALARRGVEVVDIPGHHFNMLGGPQAEELGGLIAGAVKRAWERRQAEGARVQRSLPR